MPTLYIMIGAPASGKSEISQALQMLLDRAMVVCPDNIRDGHRQWSNPDIFYLAHHLTRIGLASGLNVIFDATNTNPIYRRQLVAIGSKTTAEIVAVVMMTPLATCLTRHHRRRLNYGQLGLTDETLERYSQELERWPPTINEGFNRIVVLSPDTPDPIKQIVQLPA